MSEITETTEPSTPEFHTDMPVGEILRRTRVHYGQSLAEIESILRIRASQLEALETGDVSQLPGRVYAIGFVRSYSEYLGLDGDKMVHLFKEQSVGKQKKPDLSFPVPASESKVPNLAIVGGSLFGFIVLVGFVSFLFFPREPKGNIPAVPEQLTKTQLSEAPALVGQTNAAEAVATKQAEQAQAEGADAEAEPTAPANRIVLEITDPSWIEIRNAQGAAILRQVLKPGDVYLVPDEPGLIMSTGNAGGIKIKVDGKDVPKLGEIGQIKRKIALSPDAFAKNAR
ncbi:MAG: hypothetical protein DI551_11450 [Micavibrio aeruginosavorus]|uniref:Cytoskeleton protein RodZ-like C-terminal domain-containing protein n=1 Tax=Micavibrio aeruginosavorus TaxID=349221 RepID=A0A2W5MYP7_9BACT|nr:MAG: hypothetical protein DI551_11450 [Micavibrio aeruginosavorus]